MAENAPLIVTAQLPKDLQGWANRLRQEHFPPERNYLDAHVTLFHSLPPSCEGEVRECLITMAREYAPVPARLAGIMSLGGGTALKLESDAMRRVRDEIANRFHGMLTSQDQHSPRLHVTVQNKVTSKEAKALQAELAPQVIERDFTFPGLELHAYQGGPWDHLGTFTFRGRADA
ncbi:2'-5' RNA ligase family protein [Aurantiacibacter sediminis]|uniref:2'-5' RNA ligase family protein n=1 Tax=Aurantiacibacter sediminis TaxID=2793064 RepID=A0ABS0N504_9SPHN|nr:2'-5' RNA ligase family protein [Aurantiacibacter sediminis]MBH5322865.1 2'-5' RNA ligase family protein [Aurantiacibacter sediminis]